MTIRRPENSGSLRTGQTSWCKRGKPRELQPGRTRPFFANDLNPQVAAGALVACKAAGIKSQALLDSCVLDTTVLNDNVAAKVFVHIFSPRHVITPVLTLTH
jgi:hypothetical protein